MTGRRGVATLVVAFAAGCQLYHPAPLPPAESLSEASRVDAVALRAEAADLRHPLIPPVTLDLDDGLAPEEAAVLAILLNPALRAARDTRGEAKSGLVAAGVFPNPTVDVEVDHPYGSGTAGLKNIVNLALSFDVKNLLTRSPRVRTAEANVEQVDLGVTWQEWQVAEAARLETARLGWLERRLEIVRDELILEESTRREIEKAVRSGDFSYEQLGVQRAAVEIVRRALIELEQTQTKSRSALLSLLGQPADVGLDVSPPEPTAVMAPLPAEDSVVPSCIARRLDLMALRKGYEAQDARLRQAILEQLPNVTIGFARQRDESSITFLGGFVSLGLPVFDRNQGGVELAKATRARLRDEYADRVTSVRSNIHELLGLLDVFQQRIPEVEDAIEPLASIEEVERDAAERGDVDWLSYQTVRQALLDQRLQAASLSQARAETLIGLDTACGVVQKPWGKE